MGEKGMGQEQRWKVMEEYERIESERGCKKVEV